MGSDRCVSRGRRRSRGLPLPLQRRRRALRLLLVTSRCPRFPFDVLPRDGESRSRIVNHDLRHGLGRNMHRIDRRERHGNGLLCPASGNEVRDVGLWWTDGRTRVVWGQLVRVPGGWVANVELELAFRRGWYVTILPRSAGPAHFYASIPNEGQNESFVSLGAVYELGLQPELGAA